MVSEKAPLRKWFLSRDLNKIGVKIIVGRRNSLCKAPELGMFCLGGTTEMRRRVT